MRRRTLPTAPLALVGIAALLLPACGAGDDASAAEVVRSSKPRATATAAQAEDGAAVTRRVAARLYGPIAESATDGNVAYSPVSITVALGMVRAGATGTSADQLDGFLGSDDTGALHAGLNGLDAALAGRAGKTKDDKGQDAEISLSSANSLWGQQGVTWEEPFLDTLARSYGVGLHTVDYRGDAEGARRAVNRWVGEQTHGKIPDLIPENAFDEMTRLSLVNALYLKAPWAEELDEADRAPFTRPDGSEVSAPMMTTTGSLTYATGDGWQAVTLPYAGHELGMTLLVPDPGKLDAVEGALDERLLERVLAGGEATGVHLTMPRFDLDRRSAIGDVLKGLGVTAPFETERDFDPISSDPDARPLRLKDVLHQATVTVDEKGTEAAAATAAVFETTGAMIGGVELTLDHPFLFVIQDLETHAPLFVGRVTDPTAS